MLAGSRVVSDTPVFSSNVTVGLTADSLQPITKTVKALARSSLVRYEHAA